MQALILAGGEGTRLRPLTTTIPKPVVPLVDRPFAAYMLEWLGRHGIDDVVMSCGFLASGVRAVLGDGSRYGVRLRYVEEPRPLGTGGAIKFAEAVLDERILVLNGDVLTDLDLSAQLARHERVGARGTLALVPVEDPSAYGLVRLDGDGAVVEFMEKPNLEEIDSNLISAGAYVLERDVLDLMPPDTRVSIEREVFPRLIGDGLHGFAASGYWLDIGTPQRYLQGTADILEGTVQTGVRERLDGSHVAVAPGVEVAGRVLAPALIEEGCRIGPDARVGGRSVLGAGVHIGEGSVVESAVVLEGASIGAECQLHRCIVAPGARIGDHCRLDGEVVLGEGVTVGAHNVLSRGVRLAPGVTLPDGAITF